MNAYSTMIHGICPFDGITNYYEVEIKSHEIIRCEAIVETCNKLRGTTATQEKLTEMLSEQIPGVIRLIGLHIGIRLETNR
jgi:hypothetical protein